MQIFYFEYAFHRDLSRIHKFSDNCKFIAKLLMAETRSTFEVQITKALAVQTLSIVRFQEVHSQKIIVS